MMTRGALTEDEARVLIGTYRVERNYANIVFPCVWKGKISGSEKLLVAYVSPIICGAIANVSRHAGYQCNAHPAKSESMPSAPAW